MDTHPSTGRDPVCISIESLVRELEDQGHGPLIKGHNDSFVRLTFGKFAVSAETYDIALVRLASAMVDHPHFSLMLMEALRPHAGQSLANRPTRH